MIRCAITGSNGVLGKALISKLPFKFYKFKGDIRKKKNLEKWINKKDFDILIHLAALVPIKSVNKNYKKAYEINVEGTLNLINFILKKKIKPKWFFYASTSHVYKITNKLTKISEKNKINPQNKYGLTKLMAENLLKKKMKNSQIKLCIGRIFSFTDKNQKPPFLIPSIIKKLKSKSKTICFSNLNHYRDFLSLKDIVLAIDTLRKKNKIGIYNIGSGKEFDLKDIAYLFAKKYKKKIDFKNNNKPSFLISNNKKILNTSWKPKKFNNNIDYFY
jgi:nucleoside-diphosphate-sugar epimerase